MNKIILFIFLFGSVSKMVNGQSNCNSHTQVTLCPSATLLNQTNAGMGDDAPISINQVGEDVAYQINAPHGAVRIYVNFQNVTGGYMRLNLMNDSCNGALISSRWVYNGSSNFTFYVVSRSTYFLWIDASGTRTWDISIGGDSTSTYVNIPNTQGNLQLESTPCANPAFSAIKPFLQVSYNGIFQTHPMTLSPLNAQGSMCVNTFFRNTTGIEGIKKFIFEFDQLGYSAFGTVASVPGFFLAGDWVASTVGNKITLDFINAQGLGKGDFSGMPNTCLNYHFCFDVIPVSNSPAVTNVKVFAYSDGFGAPFSGWIYSGCCPANWNCHLGLGPSAGAGVNGFGFTFNDPGNPLPIELITFDAVLEKDVVRLNWSTATEINNDYFTIEKSKDAFEWNEVNTIDGAGNSNVTLNYESFDTHPQTGKSYYRLKQTDFDGATTYSDLKMVYYKDERVNVYPNPARDFLIIESGDVSDFTFTLSDILNRTVKVPVEKSSGHYQLNISHLREGIYFLVVESNETILKKEKIIITN